MEDRKRGLEVRRFERINGFDSDSRVENGSSDLEAGIWRKMERFCGGEERERGDFEGFELEK